MNLKEMGIFCAIEERKFSPLPHQFVGILPWIATLVALSVMPTASL